MTNEHFPIVNGYRVKSEVNNHEFIGVHSCASCRYINYNGIVCGGIQSPKYSQSVSAKIWCRYWSPKMHNPPFYK